MPGLSRRREPPGHRHPDRQPADLRAQPPLARLPAWAPRWWARSSAKRQGQAGSSGTWATAAPTACAAGKIAQLTRDHSLVNDYLPPCPTSPTSRSAELPKNVITRALGMQDHVTVDLARATTPQIGDTYRALLRRPLGHAHRRRRNPRRHPDERPRRSSCPRGCRDLPAANRLGLEEANEHSEAARTTSQVEPSAVQSKASHTLPGPTPSPEPGMK
jgi:hypothetical protein